MSLSEQTRSVPQENPHSCIATLSSFQLHCGAIVLPSSLLSTHGFSASSTNQPTPRRGLNAAISSETPTRSHLLSEVFVWPCPQNTHTWPSPQRNLHAATCSLGPCTGALLEAGDSNCLAEFTARPRSASMHISWAYLKLCLKHHTWGYAGLGSGGLCNIQSSICCLHEKRLLRCLPVAGGGCTTQGLAIRNRAITYWRWQQTSKSSLNLLFFLSAKPIAVRVRRVCRMTRAIKPV